MLFQNTNSIIFNKMGTFYENKKSLNGYKKIIEKLIRSAYSAKT